MQHVPTSSELVELDSDESGQYQRQIDVAAGRMLRAIRERRGMSQVAVADLSQVITSRALMDLEMGRRRLGFGEAVRLCRYYGVDLNDLLERSTALDSAGIERVTIPIGLATDLLDSLQAQILKASGS